MVIMNRDYNAHVRRSASRCELGYTVQGERVKAPVLLSSASGFFFLSLSVSFFLFVCVPTIL